MVAEGAKPHSSNSLNGAAARKSAAAGAGAAGGGGLAAWWASFTGHGGPANSVAHHTTTTFKTLKQRASTVKWSMPVDVKVDFLRPTFETVRETALNIWVQLPPPVQQAAPFVGVAVGSGLVVFVIQQRRVHYHVRFFFFFLYVCIYVFVLLTAVIAHCACIRLTPFLSPSISLTPKHATSYSNYRDNEETS